MSQPLKFSKKLRTLAVLTSGGDAPGMNAAIRSVVRFAVSQECQVFGVLQGYRGLLEDQFIELKASSVANIIQRGGTILKTDRCEAFHKKSFRRIAYEKMKARGIEGLLVIGGDGSFRGASLFGKESGMPVIGIPGTIDNDIFGTEDTIGFDTAVNTALEAIDRIRDTASSHNRIFLVEVMGRESGFIGLQVGIAGGAETLVLPGRKQSLNSICETIDRGMQRGKTSSIIVVSEGKTPGYAYRISEGLMNRGYSCKVCILGHTQRGGNPTAHDRVLGSILGAAATAYLISGYSHAMVGTQAGEVVLIPFSKIFGKKKTISSELFELAQTLSV